ncbi:MAG: hypothetical protein UY07_C0016G0011 [Parcubacteria group bacterium GW2011_GWA1_47_8]|nr:MAG: hypothetical protein UY07_C0016G0011 [Parcubacteria group bacterium GW2011_GWA1_47_8]
MIFVLLIVVSLFLYSLHNRVRKIEESLQLRPLSQPLVPPSVSSNAFPQTPAHTPPLQSQPLSTYISPEQPAFATTPTAPSTDGGVMEWFREDWLLKLGAFILLLGFGWFVSYAFLHNWIGPLGRVTLGMLAGIGILGFGWVRMHKYVRQGSIFLGLGAMVVLISAYSSAFVYDLFPARGALVIMFLTSAFIALASVRFKILSLAVLGIIIASVAPTTLLVNASPTHVELFAYLFAVILGTVWIVSLTGWRSLTGVGLLMFFFYSIPQIGTSTPESGTLLLFAYAFAFLFFMTNTLGILKIRDGDIKPDAIIAAGNGLLLLTWIITTANPDWASLIIAGWMILFTIAAFAIFAITKRREPFFVYAGVGIAMLAAAPAHIP